jgi:Tol biopolymer transport system component
MALSPGERFGSYEIAEAIGAGGMGEVFRATDTSLKRDVAVKALPESFAGDADRLARFQREAEVLASLNHANIAQIYGLEKSGDQTLIVMELVEGPTLADRISQGPIAPDEALGIARQVASALEAAHGAQVVHRDLKPANVKLKDDGTVKVLDFGIAKAIDAQAISGGQSPAMTTPAMTETGVILGTAAYMSPEQARGKLVDQRTDIWAFGCLLFEMLTGQPAFGGEDVMLTLARVLDRDTDMSSMPGTVSPAVRHTIRLCLEKDPAKRISDIRDVRLALEGRFDSAPALTGQVEVAQTSLLRRAMPFAAGLIVAAIAMGALGWTLWPQSSSPLVNRFSYAVPPDLPFDGQAFKLMDVSPDGRAFVFNTPGGLYLRSMGELEARLIAGSQARSAEPVFSPDGSSLAYFNRDIGLLRTIPVSGGAPVTIGQYSNLPFGVSWQGNELLFGSAEGIWRLPATGGTPELLIEAGPNERFFGPQRLPDGDTVLFSITDLSLQFQTAQIAAQSPSGGERTVLVNGGADGRYLPTGHLIYTVDGDLFAVAFDAEALAVSGGAVPILQGVLRAGQTPGTNYAIANDGTLAYLPGDAPNAGQSSLVWVDREGREEPFGLGPRNYGLTRVSPDGDRIATQIPEAGGTEIWVSDIARPVLSPITSSDRPKFTPLWTPDSTRVVTTSFNGGDPTMYLTLADGTGELETLMTLEEGVGLLSAESWSLDGEVVFTYGAVVAPRIGLFDLEPDSNGTRSWRPLIDRSAGASMLAVSPNGEWIAYQSADTGEYGVYIEQFPGLGNRRAISTDPGGWAPAWSSAGDEIYYRRLGDGAMMAVSIQTSPRLEIGAPEVLFESQGYTPLITPQAGGAAGRDWDVAPDGRFLMIKANAATEASEIIVVQNWFEELKRLVPTE